MSSDIDRLMTDAARFARAAGDVTLGWFESSRLVVDRKLDGTEVTEADRAAESTIRGLLADEYPDDGVFGEEHGTVDGTSGRTWIIDPIDGTRGFVRGVPLFSTLVALVDHEGPAVGVIHLPALGHTLVAGRGCGCWLNERRTTVSTIDEMDEALVTTSGFDAFDARSLESVRSSGAMMRTWGDAYGYFLVATGNAEAMIDPICSPWDLAPMPVIISEAGGTFSAFDGSARFDAGHGLATNGVLHERVRHLVHP